MLDLNIEIDLINQNTFNKKKLETRTLAISNNNFMFLKKQAILSNKINTLWKINKINIFNFKSKSGPSSLMHFQNKENNPIFYTIKYNNFFLNLKSKIKRNLLLRIFDGKKIKNFLSKQIKKDNYNLIINCSSSNLISKKFFFKKINKDYNAFCIHNNYKA